MKQSISKPPPRGELRILITNREKEVYHLISQGHTDVEIGKILFLSTNTIKSYRKRLLAKFNARNSVHLVFLAMNYWRQFETS